MKRKKRELENKVTELEIKRIEILGLGCRCTDRPSLVSIILAFNKNEEGLLIARNNLREAGGYDDQ